MLPPPGSTWELGNKLAQALAYSWLDCYPPVN